MIDTTKTFKDVRLLIIPFFLIGLISSCEEEPIPIPNLSLVEGEYITSTFAQFSTYGAGSINYYVDQYKYKVERLSNNQFAFIIDPIVIADTTYIIDKIRFRLEAREDHHNISANLIIEEAQSYELGASNYSLNGEPFGILSQHASTVTMSFILQMVDFRQDCLYKIQIYDARKVP